MSSVPHQSPVSSFLSNVKSQLSSARRDVLCADSFPVCSNVLSLDACPSKCISYVLRCALKKVSKVHMSFQSKKSQSVYKKKSFSAYDFSGSKNKENEVPPEASFLEPFGASRSLLGVFLEPKLKELRQKPQLSGMQVRCPSACKVV